ncbi:hypothetical protein V6N12_061746 [Hibiscus sabdariffa]|uniref:Uncharacterized protein n=1 Tax=Hibiscus sabdariffa TaxID=183260 RepID=A0ABR2DZM9_9ROSI
MLETKFSMAWRIRTIIQSSIEETITEFHPLGAFKLSFRENVTGSPDFLANNTKSPGKVFTLSELQIATKNFSSNSYFANHFTFDFTRRVIYVTEFDLLLM